MNVVDAWQAILEREHAALYGYGIVGARLGPDAEGGVRAAMSAHETVRDRAIAAIESLAATPVPAAPAYTTTDSSSDSTPRQLAGAIEIDCAATYLQLIGSDDDAANAQSRTKQIAAKWLQDAAQRQWQWTGEIAAWPGFN